MLAHHVLIAGAGIGGLTAALALHRRGVKVTVLEQAESIAAVGAGLTLWPNALHALDMLGLSGALASRGRPILEASIRVSNGFLLQRSQPGEMADRYGFAPLAIHRAALHESLMEALPRDVVRLGQRVTRYDQDERGVRVMLESGDTVEGDLLIGADGLGSVTRQQLRPDIVPRYAGHPAWRGVAPASAAPDLTESVEAWGCGPRFGMVPLVEEIYWFATALLPEGRALAPTQHHAELIDRYGKWYAPIPDLIAATPPESILYHDVYDIPPFRGWSDGRVTLLGDAVHATTPNMGQGACMAIESAVVLAESLGERESIAGALAAYEKARYPRTSWVTEQSWLIGQMAQLSQPLACRLRNAIFRAAPGWVLDRQLRRVVDYRPGRE